VHRDNNRGIGRTERPAEEMVAAREQGERGSVKSRKDGKKKQNLERCSSWARGKDNGGNGTNGLNNSFGIKKVTVHQKTTSKKGTHKE